MFDLSNTEVNRRVGDHDDEVMNQSYEIAKRLRNGTFQTSRYSTPLNKNLGAKVNASTYYERYFGESSDVS